MRISMITAHALSAGVVAVSWLAALVPAFAQTARECTYRSPFPPSSGTPFTAGAFKNALYCFMLGDPQRTAEQAQAGATRSESLPTTIAGRGRGNPAYRYSGQHAGGPANDLIAR